MPDTDRLALVRDCYRAWETADRELVERILSEDFTFSSPPDPMLDRAGYFERCWPEIFGFDGDRIGRTEVYFGWDLD